MQVSFFKTQLTIMKKIFFAFLFATLGLASFGQTAESQPQITFEGTEHDFGNIKEGTLANYEFKFTNTGKAPLILASVQPSCGCTTPEWSKEPIMPGGKGVIKASFNSNGRPGTFQKYITVKSNAANAEISLIIKGTVSPIPVEPISPVRNNLSE